MTTDTQLEQDAFQKLYPNEHYERYLREGIRLDLRALTECRPAEISCGIISTAASSSSVKIGATHAIAGIKLECDVPGDKQKDQGRLNVQVELTALSSADARPGRSLEAAAHITDRLSSLLTSKHVVDLRQLCIAEGQACWVVYLDIVVLNDDGALFDACLLAAVASLSTLRVPKIEVDAGSGKIVNEAAALEGGGVPEQQALPFTLLRRPLALTFGVHKGQLLADLTRQELSLLASTTTIVIDEQGSLHGVHQDGGFSTDDVAPLIQAAVLQAKQQYSVLDKVLTESASQPDES